MKFRKIISFTAFFLLPITLNYVSPVLLVQAGFEKVFTAMLIVYILMTISAIFFGGAWCGFICPFGALQDQLPDKGNKPKLMQKKSINLKIITGTIFFLLAFLPILQSGFHSVNIFYHMEDTKVTMDSMHGLILYYIITVSIILICALFGKRVWCRYFCPMYIFIYIGLKISNLLKLPKLKISSDRSKCIGCHKCNASCLMGLDVNGMVINEKWNYNECIKCGECINSCKAHVLKREFKR